MLKHQTIPAPLNRPLEFEFCVLALRVRAMCELTPHETLHAWNLVGVFFPTGKHVKPLLKNMCGSNVDPISINPSLLTGGVPGFRGESSLLN